MSFTWNSQVPSHVSNCFLIFFLLVYLGPFMKMLIIENNPNLFLQSTALAWGGKKKKKFCLDMGISHKYIVFMEVHDCRVRKMFVSFYPWKRIWEISLECQKCHALWFVTQGFGSIEFFQNLNLKFLTRVLKRFGTVIATQKDSLMLLQKSVN